MKISNVNHMADKKIVTIDKGYFIPGLNGTIVSCESRCVYLKGQYTIIDTFKIRLDSGDERDNCQENRDFVFVD